MRLTKAPAVHLELVPKHPLLLELQLVMGLMLLELQLVMGLMLLELQLDGSNARSCCDLAMCSSS